MTLDYAAFVTQGPRPYNDDRLLTSEGILSLGSRSGTLELPTVVCICDGCGGYAGGGYAAEIILSLAASCSPQELMSEEAVAQLMARCSDAVKFQRAAVPEYSSMCSTVAGCVVGEDKLLIFHSGDSRVYRCDSFGLAKMTADHSLMQQMLDSGALSPEKADNFAYKNTITRCIGIDCPPPDIKSVFGGINPGEKYLICSDGLWDTMPDSEILRVIEEYPDLSQCCSELAREALERGGSDNISIIILSRRGQIKKRNTASFVLD